MRLWSIHPEYLDGIGLVALWREALLARQVLANKTKGYSNHPQLERFKQHPKPLCAIGFYLYHIYKEGEKRGYNFNKSKLIGVKKVIKKIKVSKGQIEFEVRHLCAKLRERDIRCFKEVSELTSIKLHPLFFLVEGKIEFWEKDKKALLKAPG